MRNVGVISFIILCILFLVFLISLANYPTEDNLNDLRYHEIAPASYEYYSGNYMVQGFLKSDTGKDYKNINVQIDLYNGSKVLKSYKLFFHSTEYGKVKIVPNIKPGYLPTAYKVKVINATPLENKTKLI